MAELVVQFSTSAPTAWFDRWVIHRSKLICRATHSPFSHVDLVLDDGTLLGASNNPSAPAVAGNPKGVAIRPQDYQHFSVRRWARLPCTNAQKKAFTDYACSQVGKPFDREALNPLVFLSGRFQDRNWRSDEKWFCAELMARATEEASLIWWKIIGIKNRVTPGDLLLIWNPIIDVEEFWHPVRKLVMGPYEGMN